MLQLHGVMNCYIHSANAMMKAETKGRIIGAASIVAYKSVLPQKDIRASEGKLRHHLALL